MAAVERIIEGRGKDLGGFKVARVLPHAKRRMVGPFIFLDEMGPARFAPGDGIDVRPHPHIGLATVTYLFDGEIDHRDSLGVHQTIRPGDVNWMTAGRGITHSERTGPQARAAGHLLHGIQTWVALPAAAEETDPEFHHHGADALPALSGDGVSGRLILGSGWGLEAPVKVFSPILYAHADLAAGARLALPEEHADRAVYLVSGALRVAGEPLEAGRLAVLAPGGAPEIAAERDSRLMILGGEPFPEGRFIEWNFVSTRQERIEQAKADWRASCAGGWSGTVFTLPDGETEHIPLPGDCAPDTPPRPSAEEPTS